MSIGDGKVSFVTRHADGLHLSLMGLDPRGTDDLGTGSDIEAGALATLFVVPSPVVIPTGGSTFEFTAIGYDSAGTSVAVEPVWSIVEGTPFSTIDDETGILTSGSLGEEESITVRATVGAITADADVSTQDITLDSLDVTPNSTWNMAVGGTVQFSAVGYVGAEQIAISPTWSLQSGVGSINSAGLYSAGTTPGSAVIRATFGAVYDETSIVVSAGTAVSLEITPINPTIPGGDTQLFTATAYDVYGNNVGTIEMTSPWVCFEGGTIGGTAQTATLTAAANTTAGNISYTDAIRATYGSLQAFQSFIVSPGTGGPES
jgi:hypothetical protein